MGRGKGRTGWDAEGRVGRGKEEGMMKGRVGRGERMEGWGSTPRRSCLWGPSFVTSLGAPCCA